MNLSPWIGAALAIGAIGCKGRKGGAHHEAHDGRAVGDAAPMSTDAQRPETVLVSELAIQRVDPAHPVPVDDNALARSLGMMLAESEPFAAAAEDVPTGRTAVPARVVATVNYDVVDGGPKKGRGVVVAAEVMIDWKGGERVSPSENVIVERALGPGDQAAVVVPELMEAALLQAGKGLIEKEALRQAEDAAVLRALDAADVDQVAWALELVADRRLAAALDRAITLLDSGDDTVKAAALRALVSLRDPRAVEPLTKRADFKDPERLRTIIEAVTAIGGEEAAGFLELVVDHPDPDVRKRAAEGLGRIRRAGDRR
jgi:hypothetical protein